MRGVSREPLRVINRCVLKFRGHGVQVYDMIENLKVRGHAWSGRAEREREQAALGVEMVFKDV